MTFMQDYMVLMQENYMTFIPGGLHDLHTGGLMVSIHGGLHGPHAGGLMASIQEGYIAIPAMPCRICLGM